MKKILFLLFLSVSAGCMAQFHSVKPTGYIFESKSESEESDSLPTNNKKPASKQTSWTFNVDSLRNVYLKNYYNVSLPLGQLFITSRFGWRRDPFNHLQRNMHNGLDLKATIGSPVYAMFFGKVIRINSDKRSGKYVTIQYGDYTVSYCHLSKQLAHTGDEVTPGDIVGLSGNSGRSTGPHLHITCKRKGEYVNPIILLEYIIEVRTRALEGLNSLLS